MLSPRTLVINKYNNSSSHSYCTLFRCSVNAGRIVVKGDKQRRAVCNTVPLKKKEERRQRVRSSAGRYVQPAAAITIQVFAALPPQCSGRENAFKPESVVRAHGRRYRPPSQRELSFSVRC